MLVTHSFTMDIILSANKADTRYSRNTSIHSCWHVCWLCCSIGTGTFNQRDAGQLFAPSSRLLYIHIIRQTFRHTLFFNLLLPPIILNCGYELKQVCLSFFVQSSAYFVAQESFFRNFGSILIFAFLGTFISAVGLGQVISGIYLSYSV